MRLSGLSRSVLDTSTTGEATTGGGIKKLGEVTSPGPRPYIILVDSQIKKKKRGPSSSVQGGGRNKQSNKSLNSNRRETVSGI